MKSDSPQVTAARGLISHMAGLLGQAPSFRQLNPQAQASILRDLGNIRQALTQSESPPARPAPTYQDPYALSLETPLDRLRPRPGPGAAPIRNEPAGEPSPTEEGKQPGPKASATDALARRTGALVDEVDFPAFVAGLVHGTFDAIVDSAIRQMEAFADLVSAVAKDVDQFTRENITPNQARDWLVQRYPGDLVLEMPSGPNGGQPRLIPRLRAASGEEQESDEPAWLADFGLEGVPLTEELVEETLVPVARRNLGEQRMQMLATMVLMGMSRVNVRDGTISARVRFRAAAKDKATVDYAVTQDPGAPNWGTRGSATYENHSTMVSTIGANVQSETELKAELFGEVKINFASETLPLDRFVDAATLALLQRHARPGTPPAAPTTGTPTAEPPAQPALPENPPPGRGA